MNAVRLDRCQVKAASEVLAESFYDYPMFVFYFPDANRRTRYLSWYFRNVLNCALRYGKAYTTREVSGVIFILPPGHTELSLWEYVLNGFLLTPFILGFRNYKRSMDCESFVARTQARLMQDQPHYYLWGLAAAPTQTGRGVGTALMQPVLAEADIEGLPVYLETHDQKNVRYYEKYGFELIHVDKIPKYDLPIWCMLRQPIRTPTDNAPIRAGISNALNSAS